jgi:O-antigen/teichoic acid export membrane protein
VEDAGLKLRTARTLKWNSIDRFGSQILYAVVGVVLANVVSKADFGLVGVMLVFQAFAILFVDSGFGAALLQKKAPEARDYDTVFWFNLAVAGVAYLLLWFCAPLIAEMFHEPVLTSMSRVMFLSFIFTAFGIVQTNRMMKQMEVKHIAISNLLGQIISGAVAIVMALHGYGAWSLVWQSLILALFKSCWLWCVGGWMPRLRFSWSSLKGIAGVGTGVFLTSLFNTICLNIYSFIIGIYYRMTALGVYTQADKWSKMGSASLSQIFTATFVPLLSRFQDERQRFLAVVGKVNRMVAFMTFPFMGALIILATPIFHLLFGQKWDEAIPLFQILVARGVFVILISLYSNYILALGRSRILVAMETVKDLLIVAAIFITLPFGTMTALVWGQFCASLLTLIIELVMMYRVTRYSVWRTMLDNLPYLLLTLACMAVAYLITYYLASPILSIITSAVVGGALYYIVLRLAGSVVLRDAQEYLFGRFRKN